MAEDCEAQVINFKSNEADLGNVNAFETEGNPVKAINLTVTYVNSTIMSEPSHVCVLVLR